MTERTTHTAWQLARMADCLEPDAPDSPGARFLDRIESDYWEARDYGYDEYDGPHEIADAAVPIYTHNLWQTFTDLGAYQEDPTELGEDGSDMNRAAAICLYMIADRLVRALHDEHADGEDDETEDEDA